MSRIVLAFLIILIGQGCDDSPSSSPHTIQIPRGTEPHKQRGNIIVSVSHGPKWKIGDSSVADNMFDSLLSLEISKTKMLADTPTVAIHADSTALYGDVWRVMRIAKKDSARVTAVVNNR
jgi:biopolymer transport protein ExbD